VHPDRHFRLDDEREAPVRYDHHAFFALPEEAFSLVPDPENVRLDLLVPVDHAEKASRCSINNLLENKN
jgi:hypothetical protein